MRPRPLVVVALIVLAGCARATLPYKPEAQPRGARISAAYEILGDRIRIEIDTDGRLLEQVWIMKPDGGAIAPDTVESAPVVARPGPTFSIGVGGGSWGHHGGVGSGAGVGIPVGGGSTRAEGNTVAWFPLDAAGPPPWQLYVKLAGIVPTTFPVGGPPPA
jgi:hypothetical protein